MAFGKIRVDSVKDVFIKTIEEKVLSGQLQIGERLPPERELAASMGISRTIVHGGLIELAAKGIIVITPRKGTFVNDFRRHGTTAILDSVLNYTGYFDSRLLESLLEMRFVLERDAAMLAASRRTEEDIQRLREIVEEETRIDQEDIQVIADLDFSFHHEIFIASKNFIYPLLIKSMESAYKALTREFFAKTHEYKIVFEFHKKLYTAIEEGSAGEAGKIMEEILRHGEKILQIHNRNSDIKK